MTRVNRMTAAEVAAELEAQAERRQSKRRRRPAGPSALEETLRLQLEHRGLEPAREHRFHARRKWRFDFAFPDVLVAVEVEGGTHSGGRHTRGEGFERDCEKYAEAAIAGWLLIRVTARMINNGTALDLVRRALRSRGWDGGRTTSAT